MNPDAPFGPGTMDEAALRIGRLVQEWIAAPVGTCGTFLVADEKGVFVVTTSYAPKEIDD